MSSFSKKAGVLCILCILGVIVYLCYLCSESYTPPPITNAIRLGGGISVNTPNFVTENTITLPTLPPDIDNDTLTNYNTALLAYRAAYQTIKPVTTSYDAANNAAICPTDKPIAMKNADGTVACFASDTLASYCGVGEYWDRDKKLCVACTAGSFCPGDGYLYTCPAGSYCPSGSSAPTACSTGAYCPTGSSATTVCPAGSFCPTPSTRTACPAGSFCPEGSITATACPAGSYCPAGAAAASGCPLGSFCPGGASAATACSKGEYCPAGSSATTACPAGSFCPDPSTRTACPAGSFCPTGSSAATTCPAGSYCPAGVAAATACSSGEYCPAGSSAAASCPAGSYCTDPSHINACSAGTYSSSTKATSSSTCQPCPDGTYNASTGASVCTACSSGYCPSGSTALGVCPSDSYCPNPSTKTLLPTNSTAKSGGTDFECIAPFQKSADNSSCVGMTCPIGQYVPNGVCINLPANSTANSSGSGFVCTAPYKLSADNSSCIICPAGQYLNGTTCAPCPVGSYCPDTTGVRQDCPAGWFCPIQGIIDPTKISTPYSYRCRPGYKCPTGTTGLSTNNKCPDNTFSDIGQSSCTAIPLGATVQLLKNDITNECVNAGWKCAANTPYLESSKKCGLARLGATQGSYPKLYPPCV